MIKKWSHSVKDMLVPSRGLLSCKEKNLKRAKEITSSLSDSARFNVASAVLPQTGSWSMEREWYADRKMLNLEQAFSLLL